MNVYDFDKTIYDGDSALDFYLFCLTRNIKILAVIPAQLLWAFFYFVKIKTKTQCKEKFFSFLYYIDNIDCMADEFWNEKMRKIKQWYLKQKTEDDVWVSASPEFLLRPAAEILQVRNIIASKVNPKTGRFNSLNCYGKEKASRFREQFPDIEVDSVYSDSLSDAPLFNLGKNAFVVKGDKMRRLPLESIAGPARFGRFL
ncbi:MAG: haloacid dehalogenase-like hydrolase [Treponema sp.]|jgi:phosphoserine phosphatase|nr:haloacid dehalogenase-like hydrolase [Treponema sp.]